VPVWGKETNIQGKRILRGVVRNAKDPQRMYNYYRTLSAESIALAPKAPFLVTPRQIEGHETQWGEAHKRNFPYLLYNVDTKSPAAVPQRQFPKTVETAIANEVMVADQEMRDTTGIQQAALGMESNEKSGRAVRERKKESDVGSFAYIDNLARSLTLAGKILVDLIPKIYDTPRTLRLKGEDGSVSTVDVNKEIEQDGQRVLVNDITVGKYDVTVTVGPSYSTQRQESAESMMAFIGVFKEAAPLIGDLIAKNMDWPGAQEISDRLKKILPPGFAEEETQQPGQQPAGMPGPQMPMGPPPEQALAETMGESELEMADVKLEQEKVKLSQEKVKLKGLDLDNQKKKVEIKNAGKAAPSKKTDKG